MFVLIRMQPDNTYDSDLNDIVGPFKTYQHALDFVRHREKIVHYDIKEVSNPNGYDPS